MSVVVIVGDTRVEFLWTSLALGNCGMSAIYGFRGQATETVQRDAGYGKVWNQKFVEKNLLLKILEDNLHKIAETQPVPLIFMSDRIAGGDGAQVGTADLIKIIRKKKYGILTLSQIVENPTHSGSSAIIAAIWTPPTHAKRVMHETPHYSGMLNKKERKTVNKADKVRAKLRVQVDSVVKELYG